MLRLRNQILIVAVGIAALSIGLLAEERFRIAQRVRVVLSGANPGDVAHDATTVARVDWNPTPAPVDCPTNRPIVLLLVGQSNAANYVTERVSAPAPVSVRYGGQCYRASDPLLGATGDRGSIWSRLGSRIAAASGRPVLLVPIAVGSASVEAWAPGGVLNPRLELALLDLQALGLRADAIIYQQGEFEGEGRADAAQYRRHLEALLRQLSRASPSVFVALTSKCSGKVNSAIRAAQEGAMAAAGARRGVDMDAIPDEDRRNLCHLSGAAADRIARSWLDILRSSLHLV